ncbi:MAG: CoA ester lyase [Nitrososphaerota archaeon]|nr:CoA ester lyase [Nitrososphaerota archaeon]
MPRQVRRSQLFVPGNDERKITKSFEELDCDSIVLDLEDAVPEDSKAAARTTIKRFLTETAKKPSGKEICVRINPLGSPFSKEDALAMKEIDQIDVLVVPKAEDKEKLSELYNLTGKKLILLIETARGLVEMPKVVRAEGVIAVAFGAADFANSVGGNVRSYLRNNFVKTKIAVVARAFGVDPIDNVYFDLSDIEGFRNEAIESRDLGYTGKQVIHPSQIALANEIFSPSKEEISKAKEIIEAYEKAMGQGLGAIRLKNELVDAVHYRQAKELVEKQRSIEERGKM